MLRFQGFTAEQVAGVRMRGELWSGGMSRQERTAVAPLRWSMPSCSLMKRVGALLTRFCRGCRADAAEPSAGAVACSRTCNVAARAQGKGLLGPTEICEAKICHALGASFVVCKVPSEKRYSDVTALFCSQ